MLQVHYKFEHIGLSLYSLLSVSSTNQEICFALFSPTYPFKVTSVPQLSIEIDNQETNKERADRYSG